jgi:hypothetical protein
MRMIAEGVKNPTQQIHKISFSTDGNEEENKSNE